MDILPKFVFFLFAFIVAQMFIGSMCAMEMNTYVPPIIINALSIFVLTLLCCGEISSLHSRIDALYPAEKTSTNTAQSQQPSVAPALFSGSILLKDGLLTVKDGELVSVTPSENKYPTNTSTGVESKEEPQE